MLSVGGFLNERHDASVAAPIHGYGMIFLNPGTIPTAAETPVFLNLCGGSIMAKSKTDKADKTTGKGGGIMSLLPKILGLFAVLSATVLFVAALDIGHLGLAEKMSTLAAIPVVFYLLGAVAMLFMGGSGAAPASPDLEALTAKVDDIQSKTASHIAAFQGKLDAMSGNDYDSLVEENKALKAELEAIREAERAKADNEFEQLRTRNQQLEQQIKDWAVQTVGAAVAGEENTEQAAA